MKKSSHNKSAQEAYFDSYTQIDYTGPNLTPEFNKQLIINLLLELRLEPNSNILDFGCGNGKYGYTESLVDKGYNVSFVDISTKSVDALKRRLKKRGLRFDKSYSGDVIDISYKFPTNYFDVIFLGDVFHHLTREETKSVLISLKPLLKNDSGIILGLEPNGRCPIWRLMPFYNREFVWKIEKNITHCTKQGFEKKFLESGYELTHYRYVRILPISLVEKFPIFRKINACLIKIPFLRAWSQYALISAKAGI